MKQDLKVGFIGLGNMGYPMAQNILKAGYSLYVHNRTKDKADGLVHMGAHFAATPQEMAQTCDVIVTMVANDHALMEVSESFLNQISRPLLHISMSTVSPSLSITLEKKHREKGCSFVSAPVSGRPERAKAGSLWIFLAGESSAKKQALPILESMSSKVYDLGEKPEQAAIFKLCNNFMILSLIESFSEASAMLEKSGIPVDKAIEVWGSSLFDAPVFHSYTAVFSKRNFSDGGFALDLGLKDMRLLQACADSAQMPMPFLDELHEKLLISMNLGREKYDWSAIALITRQQAGLDDLKKAEA